MQTEPAYFWSDGYKLSARWFNSDVSDSTTPLVIACSGFTGLMDIHPSRFARALCPRGFDLFSFDYRGFGKSEGQPGSVLLEDQVRDVVHGHAFAKSRLEEQRTVVLLGWGMGAGVVLEAAARVDVIGVICLNGFYDGYRFQRSHRDDASWSRAKSLVAACRLANATARPAVVAPAFEIYPLDPTSAEYVDEYLAPVENYSGGEYDAQFLESMLSWCPELRAKSLRKQVFVAHGRRNELHKPTEALALVEALPPEQTSIVWLEGGHTEWMHDDNPTFVHLTDQLDRWLRSIETVI